MWGLYTQRKPGIDGGRTATLDAARARGRVLHAARPHRRRAAHDRAAARHRGHLDRVRPRHGRPDRPPEHPAALDPRRGRPRDLAPPRGRGPADHRGVRRRPARHPGLARRRHRRRRAHRPDAADRRDHLDASSATTSLANLPRKFKSAITGHPSQDVVHEINDVAFVAVEHPELGIGYDLWVGGGLSTTPALAERLGAFVTPEQVPDAWHGVAQIFRDYGYRRLRNKARLKFLLAEWGTEKFRQVLQDEYLGYALPDGPAAPKPLTHGRPRRRAPAEGRPLLRRRHADRRPRLGPEPREARRSHRGARLDAPAHDAAPEDRHPRHPRRPGRVARRGPRRARAAGAPEPHPPRHDRVHGHRVLQARDRRDEGLRDGGRARPREASRPVRAAASDLACTSTAAPTRARASRPPTSGSRASSSRSTASRCPATRCTSAAVSRTHDRDEAGPRPHGPRPQGRRRRHRRLRRAGRQALPRRSGMPPPTRPSPSGPTAPTRRPSSDRLPRSPRHRQAHPRRAQGPRRARQRSSSAASPTTRHPPPRSSRGSRAISGRMPRPSRARWPTRRCRTSSPSSFPASTCCSSTPGTTSPRRAFTRDEVERVARRADRRRAARADRRRAGRRVRREALRARPGSVLCAPQGRAPAGRPRRLRGVVHRRAPRRGADPHEHAPRDVGRAQRPRQGQPGRRVDFDDLLDVRRRAQGAGEPARRERLPLDRLRAVHEAGRRGRRPRSGRWAGLSKTECGLHE